MSSIACILTDKDARMQAAKALAESLFPHLTPDGRAAIVAYGECVVNQQPHSRIVSRDFFIAVRGLAAYQQATVDLLGYNDRLSQFEDAFAAAVYRLASITSLRVSAEHIGVGDVFNHHFGFRPNNLPDRADVMVLGVAAGYIQIIRRDTNAQSIIPIPARLEVTAGPKLEAARRDPSLIVPGPNAYTWRGLPAGGVA